MNSHNYLIPDPLQADIKLPGLPYEVVQEAMAKGHRAISTILDTMETCISAPRTDKTNWPINQVVTVPPHQRAKFLGPGGINLKRLMVDAGVTATASPSDQVRC